MTCPTKKLGEVCDVFADGDWIETKDQSSSGIRLVQTGNIGNGVFIDKESSRARFISEATFKRLDCAEVFPGDILISRLPDPVGRACIVPKLENRMITAVDCTIIRSKKQEILPEFLLCYLNSAEYFEQVKSLLTGTTRKRISRGNLGKIEIPLPPIGEQRKIVAKLEKQFAKIDEAARLRTESLALAEKLLPAALHGIFSSAESRGWEFKTVGEISNHSLGKMLDKDKNKGEYKKYLRNVNVRWFGFDLSDLKEMRFEHQETEKYTATKGDVLICEGGYPGRAAIWEEGYPIYFQKAVHRVRFHESAHARWFLYYLYHSDLSGELSSRLTGVGIKHFTGRVLDKFKIPLPPLNEQKKIVQKLDALSEKVRALKELQAKQSADLKALKQSILREMFI